MDYLETELFLLTLPHYLDLNLRAYRVASMKGHVYMSRRPICGTRFHLRLAKEQAADSLRGYKVRLVERERMDEFNLVSPGLTIVDRYIEAIGSPLLERLLTGKLQLRFSAMRIIHACQPEIFSGEKVRWACLDLYDILRVKGETRWSGSF